MDTGSHGRDDTSLKREPRRIQLRLSSERPGRYGGRDATGRGQSKSAGERKLVVGSKEEQKVEEGLQWPDRRVRMVLSCLATRNQQRCGSTSSHRQGEKDSRDREKQGEEAEGEKVDVGLGKRPL